MRITPIHMEPGFLPSEAFDPSSDKESKHIAMWTIQDVSGP